MKRTTEEWLVIGKDRTTKQLAEFLLADLTHYPSTKRSCYENDVETIVNLLYSIRERD
jgi:hypothetical protein